MIPSKQKVSKGLFKSVLRVGRSYQSDSFSVKVFTDGSGLPRFSVVVPKKLEKSAVKRNQMKRRVYGIFRTVLLTAKPGTVCALFLKKKVTTRSLPSLVLEVNAVLRKAGVIV